MKLDIKTIFLNSVVVICLSIFISIVIGISVMTVNPLYGLGENTYTFSLNSSTQKSSKNQNLDRLLNNMSGSGVRLISIGGQVPGIGVAGSVNDIFNKKYFYEEFKVGADYKPRMNDVLVRKGSFTERTLSDKKTFKTGKGHVFRSIGSFGPGHPLYNENMREEYIYFFMADPNLLHSSVYIDHGLPADLRKFVYGDFLPWIKENGLAPTSVDQPYLKSDVDIISRIFSEKLTKTLAPVLVFMYLTLMGAYFSAAQTEEKTIKIHHLFGAAAAQLALYFIKNTAVSILTGSVIGGIFTAALFWGSTFRINYMHCALSAGINFVVSTALLYAAFRINIRRVNRAYNASARIKV